MQMSNENSQTLYVKNIQTILDNIGLSFIFRNQIPVNIIWIKPHVKQILIDQFIQNWRSEIGNSSRGHFYSLFKQEFCIEPYLLRLEQRYRIYITKFRLCNIRIPIETGRWQKITRENRKHQPPTSKQFSLRLYLLYQRILTLLKAAEQS